MSDRQIPLEGVYNFRDFGGYATPHGPVKRGRLFRSAHWARATDADIDIASSVGIRLIADLRRPGERELEPNRRPEGAVIRTICFGERDEETLPPHVRFLRDVEEITPDVVRDYMLITYDKLPHEERHATNFRNTFHALANGEGPLLVHCAAGKDRTGVLVALIQLALGVSRDDVFADYEATNTAVNLDGILAQALPRFRKRLGREVTADELSPMVGVHADYLMRALTAIERTNGSLDAYFTDVLEAGPDVREAMRAHLVEAGDASR